MSFYDEFSEQVEYSDDDIIDILNYLKDIEQQLAVHGIELKSYIVLRKVLHQLFEYRCKEECQKIADDPEYQQMWEDILNDSK
jgi:hypothetical protein